MRTVLRRQPLRIRFEALVDRSGGPDACHRWLGHLDSDGYGRLHQRKESYLAHRLAWEFAHGEPFPEGMIGQHSCDRRDCVNPAHISPGTIASNNRDAVEKRRHAFGERSGHAKLTEEDVLELRRRAAIGRVNYEALGREFGVTGKAIRFAITGERWAHLSEPEAARGAA